MVTRYLNELQGKGYLNDRPAKTHPARAVSAPAHAAPPVREEKVREEKAAPKPQPAMPVLSHEQSVAQRAVFRHACDWFELHHLCANANCRKARGCRGEPMACLRAAIPQVPESARQFVRGMIEGQEVGLDFEEAFEDAEEFQDGWAAWIAGLQAAGKAKAKTKTKAGTASKRPKTDP